jgi:hypothetical protein
MRSFVAMVACVVLAACGGGGSGPPDQATVNTRCRQLQVDYDALEAAIDRSCDRDEDCTFAGGAPEPSCDCPPSIGHCGGLGVNAAAYPSSAAYAIEQRFFADCRQAECGGDGITCICDCKPNIDLRCENHVCVSQSPACNPPP